MRNAGTQKSCRTSRALTKKRTGRSLGRYSCVDLIGSPPDWGYSNVQANCWPVTLMRISLAFASSMSLSTTQAYEHRTTSTIAGIAVQITSRRVLPWIGGPSRLSSPGRILNFSTLKQTTVVTSTKTGTEHQIRTS
jgi:hypothetical protein